MKKFTGLVLLALLVISFQNCAQHSLVSEPSLAATGGSGIGANQVSAKGASKVVLWNPDKDQFLDVGLADGKMTAYEKFGQIRGDTFCLTTEEVSELNSILTTSDICEPQVDYNAMKDKNCTMLYKFPYASILKETKEYRLGEMNTGCDQPVDLCGDHAGMLKNFATAILASLDSRLCK